MGNWVVNNSNIKLARPFNSFLFKYSVFSMNHPLAQSSDPIIQIQDLNLSFGSTVILQQVNFNLYQEQVLALIGPNGAGKSSLLQVMSGYIKANSGRVLYQGQNVCGLKPYQLMRLGWGRGFQTSSLMANLSLKEHLMAAFVAASNKPYWFWQSTQENISMQEKVYAILLQQDWLAIQDLQASQLSYANQRALDLILITIAQPSVLLLDEPTAGLSQSETRIWQEKFQALKKNKTVLLVEHDMELVFSVADQIAVLDQGQIIAVGTADQIKANKAVQQAYLGALEPGLTAACETSLKA